MKYNCLQYCVSFCCTAMWISYVVIQSCPTLLDHMDCSMPVYNYTYIPFLISYKYTIPFILIPPSPSYSRFIFTCECPIVSAPFIEKAIFASLCGLWSFVTKDLLIKFVLLCWGDIVIYDKKYKFVACSLSWSLILKILVVFYISHKDSFCYI